MRSRVAARAIDHQAASRADAPRALYAAQSASAPEDMVAPHGMVAVHVVSVSASGDVAVVRFAGREIAAAVDQAVERCVLDAACARGERVIVQREGETLVVLGALRTRATPGLEPGDDFKIEARRVVIEGAQEVTLRSGTAAIALRAYGFVETLAQDITTRAARAHKLVGRVLRLN